MLFAAGSMSRGRRHPGRGPDTESLRRGGVSALDSVSMDRLNTRYVPTSTLIVLAADQASLYEFLKPRQESKGQTLVILDRRRADRRNREQTVHTDHRRGQRRRPHPEAALALMSVLGFMILGHD